MKILRVEAQWCPECVIFMKPVWDEIEKLYPEIEMQIVDYDKDEEIKLQYSIAKVPTFIFFDANGDEILRKNGIVSRKEIEEIINTYKEK